MAPLWFPERAKELEKCGVNLGDQNVLCGHALLRNYISAFEESADPDVQFETFFHPALPLRLYWQDIESLLRPGAFVFDEVIDLLLQNTVDVAVKARIFRSKEPILGGTLGMMTAQKTH